MRRSPSVAFGRLLGKTVAKATGFRYIGIGALARAASGHSALRPIGQRPTLRGHLLRNRFGLGEEQKVVTSTGFRICS
jgi:hypothetical protein